MTNPIESFNSTFRKITKNKGSFPTDDSLFKILHLAIMDNHESTHDTFQRSSRSFNEKIYTLLMVAQPLDPPGRRQSAPSRPAGNLRRTSKDSSV